METSSLKRIVNKYTETSLIIRILIGMAIGVVLALAVPQFTGIKILGDLFVGALKAIAPLLVCLLIMSSLAQTKEGHNGNMKTVVILYMFSTIMGAIVAVAGSFLFPLKITLADAVQQEAPKGVVEVLENLLLKIVANPIDALVNANYLGVLAWAVILGIALKKSTPGTKQMLSDASDAVCLVVGWFMNIGIFCFLGFVFIAVSNICM